MLFCWCFKKYSQNCQQNSKQKHLLEDLFFLFRICCLKHPEMTTDMQTKQNGKIDLFAETAAKPSG